MKKIFALLLAIVYLGSTVGATVHLHYCMDRLVNWTVRDEGSMCKNCGMEKGGGCCNDESKFIKNDVDQSATGAMQALQAPAIDTHVSFTHVADGYSLSYVNEYRVSHAPPLKTGIEILLHNCIFRI